MLDHLGGIDIAAFPMPDECHQPAMFALANKPVTRDNIWLYHKTSQREIYELAVADHPEVFDVLLWNEQRELTEFTRGNLVLELDGCKLTPAIDSGVLDGCLRREMLDQGEIQEATLTLDDLAHAQRIWFINSLRGCIEMFQQQSVRMPA